MDARDRLTVVLTVARKRGVRIEERLFASGATPLADLIRDVRGDIQALDGQLALCEDMARRESAVQA